MSKAIWLWLLIFIMLWSGLVGGGAKAVSKLPTKPPKNAIILFDGKSTNRWVHPSGQPCQWVVKDGYMEIKVGSGYIMTKEQFQDFQLHLEFWLPLYPENVKGQARANSGVFLQGRYEIQILDSYMNPTYKAGGCGAIYGQKDPDNFDKAVLPPERWNTWDITFRALRFDEKGNVIQKPRVTVFWNGVKVHDNVEINIPTSPEAAANLKAPGPIMIQDHGCPIRFRNIWIVPLKAK